ncbi:MAG: RnfABCDGE type electron transport complex subunit B [Candidatus Omnitrophica bacterium]|nr:RnfABCDGE type electron transport complex subunit B [Candidatus Omnitrophota bacterium]MCM8830858.1 RnfABCDGE type electron transport complex subunit B [Candidatus Omnitrophota bacterium]
MLSAVVILSSLGFVFGISLAIASRFLKIKINEKLESIYKFLPGANCGACGKAGCFGFAQALLYNDLSLDCCRVATDETKANIANILGIKFEKKTKLVAVVHCNGGDRVKDKFIYNGIKDCIYANLELGGQKECFWGCLGFGTCVGACPFGAISMSAEKIPLIDKNKCTGCGKCVEVCPKKLFSLVPVNYEVYVACSSCDTAKITRKVCPVGCIACGICTKVTNSTFFIKDNHAYIDYDKVKDTKMLYEAMSKCPVKCIVKR